MNPAPPVTIIIRFSRFFSSWYIAGPTVYGRLPTEPASLDAPVIIADCCHKHRKKAIPADIFHLPGHPRCFPELFNGSIKKLKKRLTWFDKSHIFFRLQSHVFMDYSG
jgi:hypothetical protein